MALLVETVNWSEIGSSLPLVSEILENKYAYEALVPSEVVI